MAARVLRQARNRGVTSSSGWVARLRPVHREQTSRLPQRYIDSAPTRFPAMACQPAVPETRLPHGGHHG